MFPSKKAKSIARKHNTSIINVLRKKYSKTLWKGVGTTLMNFGSAVLGVDAVIEKCAFKKRRNVMSKRILISVVFLASVICAVIIQYEPLGYIFTAIAFFMLEIYNTMEHKVDGKKSSLYFSIMFYSFSVSAFAFGLISIFIK